MTAEEMFRNLGYIKYFEEFTGDIVYSNQNLCVEFLVNHQTVVAQRMTCSGGNAVNYGAEVDVALFQAIQKQLEELEWLK